MAEALQGEIVWLRAQLKEAWERLRRYEAVYGPIPDPPTVEILNPKGYNGADK